MFNVKKTFGERFDSLKQRKCRGKCSEECFFYLVTNDIIELSLQRTSDPTPIWVISSISAQCVCAHPDLGEHNGYVVPKRIIKQFLFRSQETQLHHGATKTLHHAIHGISWSLRFSGSTKLFESSCLKGHQVPAIKLIDAVIHSLFVPDGKITVK